MAFYRELTEPRVERVFSVRLSGAEAVQAMLQRQMRDGCRCTVHSECDAQRSHLHHAKRQEPVAVAVAVHSPQRRRVARTARLASRLKARAVRQHPTASDNHGGALCDNRTFIVEQVRALSMLQVPERTKLAVRHCEGHDLHFEIVSIGREIDELKPRALRDERLARRTRRRRAS